MDSTRSMLDIVQDYMTEAIEKTGRTPRLFGVDLTPSEAASPLGGLPIFFEVVRQEVVFLGESNWLRGLALEQSADPRDSLVGAQVVCHEINEQTPRYPVIALFDKALSRAMELSPDPDSIELSELFNQKLSSEVLSGLSINRWPEIHSAEKDTGSPSI